MRKLRQLLVFFTASAFIFALAANAQDDSDSPSLGDVARQARQQKQQKDAQTKDASAKDTPSKDAQTKDAPGKEQDKDKVAAAKDAQPKAPHVITNEELPEHIGPTRTLPGSKTPGASNEQPGYSEGKAPAEYWKDRVMAQKNAIASLKANIDSLSASIQYAGGNCVSNCVQWNERQKQKQDQVDAMKSELEQAQKNLEDLQEAARRQGYGSSVYDP